MKPAKKTNAARLLDQLGVTYELVAYEVDEEELGAVHVAAGLGQDVAVVFKTILLRGDRTGPFVCVVPGDAAVDLKAAAAVSGNKKAEPLPLKELLPLTGYVRGGCSPIGMKKNFPTYLHESATLHPFIFVSAGQRGLQFKLAPSDLVRATAATVCVLV